MNKDDMESCKKIMIQYQTNKKTLNEEEKASLKDFVMRDGLDNFSIMATAMMLSSYIKVESDLSDNDYKCYSRCVENPLKAAEMVATRVVRDMDEFYVRVNNYMKKKIEGGCVI